MGKRKNTYSDDIKKEKVGAAFEKLVAVIESAFRPDEVVKHNIKKRESSGINRQIDVSIEGRNIIIECKDHAKKRVSLAEMDAFINLCKSTKSEGIFVSRKGFSKNVIKKADFENIKIYTLNKINSDSFKENFYVPEVTYFVYNIKYIGHTFHIPEQFASLLPLIRDDEYIYRIDIKEKYLDETVVKDIYQQAIIDNQMVIFKPLVDDFLFREKEKILNKIFNEPKLIGINGQLHFLSNKQFVPIAGITIKIEYFLSLRKGESEVYHQRDKDENLLSETVSSEMSYLNKPYKINVVNTKKDNKISAALVPKFNSSEILKLKNIGELKNPFKK